MDVLAVILIVIVLFIILSLKSSLNSRIDQLFQEVRSLKDQLSKTSTEIKPADKPAPVVQPPATPPVKEIPHEKANWESGFKVIEGPSRIDKLQEIGELLKKERELRQQAPVEVIKIKEPIVAPAPETERQQQPGFFERHPNLEKFIGENLINKIGIAILVLAIGFFVKYAIDQNWVGPVGRVGIGILCGAILVALAHRLRANYKAFSSVLVGGGLAVFYFTIALAYHQFHLFSQPVSFIIMIIITAFAVTLSVLYDRQELAVIALVGGFATPFMVSNGNGDYKTLFTYLLILNTGLLIIAYNKAWRLLNILAFVFTAILFTSWIITLADNTGSETYRNGFVFASAFYLLFFVINIANNIKENKRFIASDFGILLLNTCLFFTAGLFFLTAIKADGYRGLFSSCMGLFNLAVCFFLFRKQKTDRNILYLLVGLTLTFISLTAPIQLHGNYITLFWASECVLLYWLYQRSGIGIIRFASLIIWIAMLVSLTMDWFNIYNNTSTNLPVVFNKGFITSVYAAIASWLLFILSKRDGAEAKMYFPAAGIFRIAGLIILFTAGILEITHQFLYYYPNTTIHIQYLLLYSYIFFLLFAFITQRLQFLKTSLQVTLVILSVSLVLYLLFITESFSLMHHMLSEKKYNTHFMAHWAGSLLLGIIFFYLTGLIRTHSGDSRSNGMVAWLLCSWIVIFLSCEVYLLSNRLYYNGSDNWDTIGEVFVKTGLPILWGLCSFAFMWLGMRHKFRPLRIISLTLFSITLIKLFFFDIRNIPAGGKIAAFFCLGVLLLVVSFMYQRLKRIIIEDEKKPAE